MTMDKYLKAIEMTEHPERFSSEELQSLLADPEISEYYNLLSGVDSALHQPPAISKQRIDDEWTRFKKKTEGISSRNLNQNQISSMGISHDSPKRRKGVMQWFFGRRVAVVAAIIVTSVAALAIGIGLMTRSSSDYPEKLPEESSAMTIVAVDPQTILPEVAADTTSTVTEPVIFENEKLRSILETISHHYNLRLEVVNNHAADMRLFFRWNPADEASEVVRQLNNFDRIKLKIKEEALILM